MESTSFPIRCSPRPPGLRLSRGFVVSTAGPAVGSKRSASSSITVTSTPPWVGVREKAVGSARVEGAGLAPGAHRRLLQARERHRGERKARRLVSREGAARRLEVQDRPLPTTRKTQLVGSGIEEPDERGDE